MRRSIFLLFLLVAATGLRAEALAPGGAGLAVEIVDGDTLVLKDGRSVRLVGLQAPKLPLGRKGFKTWPLAEAAKRHLTDLALGKRLTLSYGGRRTDRYDRLLAHLHDPGGLWIQGAMLEAGMARVYTFPDNRALAVRMLALERTARTARRGIWADRFYRVRGLGDAMRDVGSFQLIEGRVRKVAVVRGRSYLNFGADWRRDFTISIDRRHSRVFASAGLDPRHLEGRLVRVRGWLKSRNGPMIEATHPEQIEVLE